MNLKKVIAIFIMFLMIMTCGYTYADDEVIPAPDDSNLNETYVTYSLIDGDLTNDSSLTEPNTQFSSLIKYFSDGKLIHAFVVPEHTRITIDYSNDIFKGIKVRKSDEEVERDLNPPTNNQNESSSGTGEEPQYDIIIDPERTVVSSNENGTGSIIFYGNYTNKNGQKVDNRHPSLRIELYTYGISKNVILGNNYTVATSGSEAYVRFEVGMNVADFKNAYKNVLNAAIKPSEIVYLNNNGEYKMGQYKWKIGDNFQIGDKNNPNVRLIDSGKIYTGIWISYDYDIDYSTMPKDLEIDWKNTGRTVGIAIMPINVNLVVPGDITGTGEIDVTDVSTMQEELVESIELEGAYEQAADMDESGEVDIVDLSQLQEYIVNN